MLCLFHFNLFFLTVVMMSSNNPGSSLMVSHTVSCGLYVRDVPMMILQHHVSNTWFLLCNSAVNVQHFWGAQKYWECQCRQQFHFWFQADVLVFADCSYFWYQLPFFVLLLKLFLSGVIFADKILELFHYF